MVREKVMEVINLIAIFLSIIIPVIFFFITSSEEIKSQTYIIFGIIIFVSMGIGGITYIVTKWKIMGKDIGDTKKEIDEIKKDLNFKELWNSMDVRMRVLESLIKKNKKGQSIDPRILMWILLAILLYLFLKSIGFFK